MHKWQLYSVVSLSLIGLYGSALASDVNAIAPTNDTLGCAGLIQQGDTDPPIPTRDLRSLQICMNNCDGLYRTLGDHDRFTDMMRGANYCRKSLNNLYFASIAQTVTEQLDHQTELQRAAEQQSVLDTVSQLIKQQQQQQQNQQAAETHPAENQTTDTHTTTSATPPAQPPVSLENINW